MKVLRAPSRQQPAHGRKAGTSMPHTRCQRVHARHGATACVVRPHTNNAPKPVGKPGRRASSYRRPCNALSVSSQAHTATALHDRRAKQDIARRTISRGAMRRNPIDARHSTQSKGYWAYWPIAVCSKCSHDSRRLSRTDTRGHQISFSSLSTPCFLASRGGSARSFCHSIHTVLPRRAGAERRQSRVRNRRHPGPVPHAWSPPPRCEGCALLCDTRRTVGVGGARCVLLVVPRSMPRGKVRRAASTTAKRAQLRQRVNAPIGALGDARGRSHCD